MRDTIFALATAPGRAAVAVIRLSGPDAGAALQALAGRRPAPRRATLRKLRDADGRSDRLRPGALVPRPGQLHRRGRRRAARAWRRCGGRAGDRGAGCAGPAACRAGRVHPPRLRGRHASTSTRPRASPISSTRKPRRRRGRPWRSWKARSAAGTRVGAGRWPRRWRCWRRRSTFRTRSCRRTSPSGRGRGSRSSRDELERAQGDARRGERVREGYRIALIGAPNAGKSRLFNAMLAREAAIVTATPGTTRDVHRGAGGDRRVQACCWPTWPGCARRPRRSKARACGAPGPGRKARRCGSGSSTRRPTTGAWREAGDLVRPADILVLNKTDLPAAGDGAAAASCGAARS